MSSVFAKADESFVWDVIASLLTFVAVYIHWSLKIQRLTYFWYFSFCIIKNPENSNRYLFLQLITKNNHLTYIWDLSKTVGKLHISVEFRAKVHVHSNHICRKAKEWIPRFISTILLNLHLVLKKTNYWGALNAFFNKPW